MYNMYLFWFSTNLKTIYGGRSPNIILFNAQQKKGKKDAKKGKFGFAFKIENLKDDMFRQFSTPHPNLPFLASFLPFFCWGLKIIVFRLFAPQMVFKLTQKQKRTMAFNIFVSKSGQNVLLEVNFSKFHKMVLLQARKSCFGTKNRVAKGNGLFYQFLIKKGKRGMIYLNFDENLNFEIFWQFLTKIQIYPFWYPFWYPFFEGGSKVLCLGSLPHKWFLNWSKSKQGT